MRVWVSARLSQDGDCSSSPDSHAENGSRKSRSSSSVSRARLAAIINAVLLMWWILPSAEDVTGVTFHTSYEHLFTPI